MHLANRQWWQLCEKKYAPYFKNVDRVLEVGSLNINGSVRDHFQNIKTYIGVDWRQGPCVDLISLAHEMEFGEKFNTIISCSMLEHDPYWEQSITRMVELLRDDGALFLSWGAALCAPHEIHTAPDKQYHALPAGKVLNLLKDLGMYVHEFRYEASMPCRIGTDKGWGEVAAVSFKSEQYSIGDSIIDPLIEEDKA